MDNERRKTYIIEWEWYGNYFVGEHVEAVIKERVFLWWKRKVIGGFKNFKEAAEYIYNNLGGKISNHQYKKIFGK